MIQIPAWARRYFIYMCVEINLKSPDKVKWLGEYSFT
jgi:hypothetical protein